ncbi:MAG: serine/threonine-protein kinase [Armatimonadota bacterium]|nr:serine/threonine protein kinase [bacterium]MCS7309686.1 serine/threonine protein kinase [Armatimonadota bacterium]MDW8290943.1 serine/threonine-protein kinase [Armatimonadota bacterium]
MALSPIGKYERVDVLGYGATGIVYLAWDSLLRKQVALKEINVQAGDMERFLEEARLLDRLNHPNIVRVHSVDKVEGKVLIAMEYVPGVNLQELLRQQGRLPIPQALDIAIQVLDALDYAHRNHTIHRDIKPGNILIRRDGVVKLVDFGLATILGTGSYAGGAGTYVYMAPEDFEEEERSDHRSDLWAVGVTLYEMVTGHRPFNASNPKNPFSWQEAVQKQQPPPLQQYVPDAPAALQTVIDRALAKRKEERFPTAGEFAQALRRVQVLLPDAGGETLAVVSAQAYGAQQRKESVAAGASKSPRSAIVKVEPQEVSFGPVRQGEQCVAKVVVRSTNRKPLDARLASHPGWLYVHPPVLQRKQQVVTLTADTGMVSAQGALCDVVQFVNGEQRISIPVRLEVLPPRPQFRQVAYWYVPLFVSCLVPLFTVVLGSGDWSRWMPIGLELSGLLGAMLVLITMGAELRSGERMAAVLLMLTGLSATGTYLGVLGDPQNHPQGKIAVDLLTVMGAVLLLQLFSTRRWKWWAWVLVGLSLGLSGVIASVTRGGV